MIKAASRFPGAARLLTAAAGFVGLRPGVPLAAGPGRAGTVDHGSAGRVASLE
jgi:hypothetical protein